MTGWKSIRNEMLTWTMLVLCAASIGYCQETPSCGICLCVLSSGQRTLESCASPRKVTVLILHNVGLEAINPSAFPNQTNQLQDLYLGSNKLTSLPDNVFDELISLNLLNLRSNQLTTLPDNIFGKLINLRELHLQFNLLTFLPPSAFEKLSNLQQLDISNNRLLDYQLCGFLPIKHQIINFGTLRNPLDHLNASFCSMNCSGAQQARPVCDGLNFCTGTFSNYTCNSCQPSTQAGAGLPGFKGITGNGTTLCQAGFYSDKQVTCSANGILQPANCIAYNCSVRLTSGIFTGAAPFFSAMCDDGYQIIGNRNVTCLTAVATTTQPNCKRIMCPADPPSIANGYISAVFSSFFPGDTAKASCLPGYQRTGAAAITCDKSGQWPTGVSLPSCKLISCTLPRPPSNGSIVSSSTSPAGLTVFACNKGYKLKGSSVTLCLSNGNLSNPTPTCSRVSCSLLTHPTNGSVSPGDNNFETIRSYTCSDGFKLIGFATTTCRFNGIWSAPQPTCQLITCPAVLPSIANGYFSTVSSSFTIGGTANILCLAGYQRTGAAVITCDSSGQWPTSDSLPSCKLISCPSPSPPFNGLIVSSSTSPNGVTVFACNKGYKLAGSSVAVCLTNGNLSNSAPTCARVSCSLLTRPRNGSVSPGDNNFETIRNYTCSDGFKLIGFATTTCHFNGVWSAPQPTCQRITCPTVLPSITNGYISTVSSSFMIGGTANISCLPGYQRTGTTAITCNSSGQWPDSDYLPSCKLISCALSSPPSNGLIVSSSTSPNGMTVFACNKGYKLMGSSVTVCLTNGNLSNPAPTCARVSCSLLTHPMNGSVSPGDNSFETIRNYTCNDGFKLIGFATTTCRFNGVWSAPQPTCQSITCPAVLPSIANGYISTVSSSFTIGGSANISCLPGYQRTGAPAITCNSSGQWPTSDSLPSCKLISCALPSTPSNGSVVSSSTSPAPDRLCMQQRLQTGWKQCHCMFDEWKFIKLCADMCKSLLFIFGTSTKWFSLARRKQFRSN
ncbi:sushi, von Willebrand factor type A, EGF and pentraxin domain-containing protein 1-like [Sycon ciliatum]|uniref:sushi, von Willebrand factor type A, EGF and pentraxin domain-containing protein 1-like n=1 Tax=Sycon ciliatum TaxID=27933 RepID=UPI0031F600B2